MIEKKRTKTDYEKAIKSSKREKKKKKKRKMNRERNRERRIAERAYPQAALK